MNDNIFLKNHETIYFSTAIIYGFFESINVRCVTLILYVMLIISKQSNCFHLRPHVLSDAVSRDGYFGIIYYEQNIRSEILLYY